MTCAADCPTCPADVPQGDPLVVPHELHVTVDPTNRADMLGEFRAVCEALGVRPVVMLVLAGDSTMHLQAMTASSIVGSDRDARQALVDLGDNLIQLGWDPIRAKIEAAPWHPRAVVGDTFASGLPDGAYWESHVGLWIRPADLTPALRREVDQLNGYLSRNMLRPPRADGAERWSLSIRSSFMSREAQTSQALFVRDIMKERRLEPSIPRTEFTWWDSVADTAMVGGPPFGAQVPTSAHSA